MLAMEAPVEASVQDREHMNHSEKAGSVEGIQAHSSVREHTHTPSHGEQLKATLVSPGLFPCRWISFIIFDIPVQLN